MRVLVSWLRDFVDVPVDPVELAARLGMRGLEVASIESWTCGALPPWAAAGDLPDAVIDFDITANRPDCLSVVGIAREVSATYDLPLYPHEPDGSDGRRLRRLHPGEIEGLTVSLEEPALCPRYGAAVADVLIQPSPAWLAARLEAAGVRPINNVVDVTNYVLIELGHPMHAFDLERLGRATLRIRRAGPAERITTLDGEVRQLTGDVLVIADDERAQAVAGIMGCAASEVAAGTKIVAIESAFFNPVSVRRTSKRLTLKTEASTRFERGTDIDMPVRALERACFLLEQTGAGRARTHVIDRYPEQHQKTQVRLRSARIQTLLGQPIDGQFVERKLAALGFSTERIDAGWQVTVPAARVDVTREADLIEEVARHYGYDLLTPTFPALKTTPPAPDVRVPRDQLVRRVSAAAGFTEAITFAFIETKVAELFMPGDAFADVVGIGNPLSASFSVMRPSLIPGLVDAVAHNRRHGRRDVRLFELGSRFSQSDGETRGVAFAWTGAAAPEHWSGSYREADFFDIRGIVDRLNDALETSVRIEAATRPYLVPGQTASIVLDHGPIPVGVLGVLSPIVCETRGLPRADRVLVAELNLDKLWFVRAPRGRAVRAFPRYPSIVRDLSIVVDEELPAGAVRDTIRAAAPPILESVREFDRYVGKGVPDSRVSLSLHLTFRSTERTLTDAEVQQAMLAIVGALGARHNATQR